MTHYWLFKSEPDCYSIQDLAAEPSQTTRWDGIRNYQARNFLRDQVATGDKVFIYHSQCKQVGIAGTATVVTAAYPDPQQFTIHSDYYDSKSTAQNPRWFCVDIQLEHIFNKTLPLAALKQMPPLENMVLFKQGRLSIQPVTAKEWQHICRLAE